MPGFASGYATGSESEAGEEIWDRLTFAFAPFLGPVADPTRMMFGKGFERSLASFSGGRPSTSAWGGGWEFTTINDFVKAGKSNRIFTSTTKHSMVVGFRKMDSTARTANIIAADTASQFDPQGYIMRIRNTRQVDWVIGGNLTGPLVPSTASFHYEDNVWGVSIGAGHASSNGAVVDGLLAPADSDHTRTTGTEDVYIGKMGLADADLMVISFIYVFDGLMVEPIARLCLDPGMLFRPFLVYNPVISGGIVEPPPTLARTDQVDSGVDIDCMIDVGQSLSLARGLRNLGNAIARRRVTPRGGLFYDANYGLDVRAFLNAGMTPQQLAQVQADVAAEVSKDERVENPEVTVVSNTQTATMTITIVCELAEGPFRFLVAVNALTVELLNVEALS